MKLLSENELVWSWVVANSKNEPQTQCQRGEQVTSVHGIHYIGDKRKVLSVILERLSEQGIFIANPDLNNIHFLHGDADKYLKEFFKQNIVQYNSRTAKARVK